MSSGIVPQAGVKEYIQGTKAAAAENIAGYQYPKSPQELEDYRKMLESKQKSIAAKMVSVNAGTPSATNTPSIPSPVSIGAVSQPLSPPPGATINPYGQSIR